MSNDVVSEIYQRIEKAFNGASMAEIARRLGLAHSTIRNYRSGRIPEPDVLVRIKKETNVSIDWLLTGQSAEDEKVADRSTEPVNIDFDNVHVMFSNFRRPKTEQEMEQFRLEMEIVILEAQKRIKQNELLRKKYESNPQDSSD